MSWSVKLAKDAVKRLKRLPRDDRARIRERLHEMEDDPFQGDVKPLKGKRWEGRYRKRIGPWRVIFTVDSSENIVNVSAILPRSEQTYR